MFSVAFWWNMEGSSMCHSARLRQVATTLFLLVASTETASANIVFDFSGTCTTGCTGTATGVLTLTNAYVYGTALTVSDLVSFQYTSSDITFTILPGPNTFLAGGLNADGTQTAVFDLDSYTNPPLGETYFDTAGPFESQLPSGLHDSGLNGAFTAAVPEPSTWAMMLLGFAGIGLLANRRSTTAANAKRMRLVVSTTWAAMFKRRRRSVASSAVAIPGLCGISQ